MTVGSASGRDVSNRVNTVNAVSDRSQYNTSKIWNAKHDRMRALPVELRLLCLGSLPTVDKWKLSRVCSFWRDTIAQDPAIWTKIDVLDRPLELAGTLRRSQQLPVDVTVSVRTQAKLRLTTMVLRVHAHRLRRLQISLLDKSVIMMTPAFTRLFDFAVPRLRALELRCIPCHGAPRFILPAGTFNGDAPRLRSLALYGVGVADNCPALANVTTAFIQGVCMGLTNILKSAVALERLELVNVLGHPRHGLPEIGTHAALADVRIHDARPDFASLQRLGYVTKLARLEVTSADGIAAVAAAAAHLVPTSESTLVIGPSGATELLVSHAAGARTASFAAGNVFFREIRTSFSAFRDITRLVLPLYLNTTDYTSTGERTCPLLPVDIELVLPRLVSLTIRCASYSTVGCELFDPAIARGSIVAPLLARLEITGGPMDRGKVFYVCPGELATFVEDHLELAPGAQLEVVIDAANGVGLWSVEKDIARLRRCVGQLIL